MRTVAMPGRTTGVVVCEWQRLGGRLSARWRYASQPSALQAGAPGPLYGLTEALAPLSMPNVQYASRTRAAIYVACSAATPIAISVAVVVIHLAAVRFVFLPIGTA